MSAEWAFDFFLLIHVANTEILETKTKLSSGVYYTINMTNVMTFLRYCVTRTNYTTIKLNKVIVILTLLGKMRRLSFLF